MKSRFMQSLSMADVLSLVGRRVDAPTCARGEFAWQQNQPELTTIPGCHDAMTNLVADRPGASSVHDDRWSESWLASPMNSADMKSFSVDFQRLSGVAIDRATHLRVATRVRNLADSHPKWSRS